MVAGQLLKVYAGASGVIQITPSVQKTGVGMII
jgi:hypothetical protein